MYCFALQLKEINNYRTEKNVTNLHFYIVLGIYNYFVIYTCGGPK